MQDDSITAVQTSILCQQSNRDKSRLFFGGHATFDSRPREIPYSAAMTRYHVRT